MRRLARHLRSPGGEIMLLAASRVDQATLWSWEVGPLMSRVSVRGTSAKLIGVMTATLAVVAGLATWDAERESAAALRAFAQEQATLAGALGAALRLGSREHTALDEDGILAGLRSVERPHALKLLLHRPGTSLFRGTDGRVVLSARLISALDRGETVALIPRTEAAPFGLPARMALAGLARVDIGAGTAWEIVAVASAERERDRERWARMRLVLSVLTAAGLVLAFGGLAMRNQRKELLLKGELALASLQHSRDERLQRASKAAAMGTLAMGVAHEISTPLGVIAARVEQMAPRVAGDEKLSAGMTAILAQTDRISQVMRGLLGLARGDAPSAERVEPGAVVAQAVGLVEHRFAQAGVRLSAECAPDLPSILGDPRLLEHAVVNLLLNACEACRPGGEVMVRARMRGGASGRPEDDQTDDEIGDETGDKPDGEIGAGEREVEIAVEDSGAGISRADIGRAFEPFFTTKAREGGTGLGLAIAREIVAHHRGRLVLSERQPRGTRAAIFFPPAEVARRG
jgi:two-component system NtrC family sensor kinase